MRRILSERSPPATLRLHRLANLLDFAQASLEDVISIIVHDVVEVLIPRSNDARVFPTQVVLRHAVARHVGRRAAMSTVPTTLVPLAAEAMVVLLEVPLRAWGADSARPPMYSQP